MTLTRISVCASFLPILPEARTRAFARQSPRIIGFARIVARTVTYWSGIICQLAFAIDRDVVRVSRGSRTIGQLGSIFWRIAMLIVAPVDARPRSASR